jgi:hypothetical protein
MSRSYWVSLVAIGWLVLSGLSYAQEQSSPTLESQPVTPSQYENADEGKTNNSSNKQPQAEQLAPILKQIESAIRDAIPQKNEAKDQRQEDADKADLQAQEDMAFWAKLMLWATAITAIITFGGLILIWRTLHHTRRAADYAFDMVNEAKATTQAARDAVAVTQKIGEAQVRAYLTCLEANYKITKKNIFCTLKIANKGQSPADRIILKPILKIRSIKFNEFMGGDRKCDIISAGSVGKASFDADLSDLGPEVYKALYNEFKTFAIDCEISWYDVFDKKQIITVWLFSPVYVVPILKKDVISLEDKFRVEFAYERENAVDIDDKDPE